MGCGVIQERPQLSGAKSRLPASPREEKRPRRRKTLSQSPYVFKIPRPQGGVFVHRSSFQVQSLGLLPLAQENNRGHEDGKLFLKAHTCSKYQHRKEVSSFIGACRRERIVSFGCQAPQRFGREESIDSNRLCNTSAVAYSEAFLAQACPSGSRGAALTSCSLRLRVSSSRDEISVEL